MPLRVKLDYSKIKRAVEEIKTPSLYRVGGFVRTIMRRQIKRKTGDFTPSPAGTSPFTHNGLLKNSIKFAVKRGESVLIGTDSSMITTMGKTLDRGGTETGDPIPRRKASPKKTKTATDNILRLGDWGPIREEPERLSGYVWITLDTPNRVARGNRIYEQVKKERALNKDRKKKRGRANVRRYPKRPFVKPSLNRSISGGKLESFFKDAIN